MITSFSGEYRFLSNFWPCDIFGYPSVENAYVAAKLAGNHEVLRTCSPSAAKRYGKNHEMKNNWNSMKLRTMRILVCEKFEKHAELMKLLQDTGDQEIIEGNTWGDTYWGQCPIGNGRNELGKILMNVREASKFF